MRTQLRAGGLVEPPDTTDAVRVASDGTFRLRLQHVHGDAQLVAQVLGNGTVAGAGTPVARLTVTH